VPIIIANHPHAVLDVGGRAWGVFTDLSKQMKTVANVIRSIAGWFVWAEPTHAATPGARQLGLEAGSIVNLVSACAIPEKLAQLGLAFHRFIQNPSHQTAREVFFQGMSLISSVCSAFSYAARFTVIGQAVMSIVKRVNWVVTAGTSLHGVIKNSEELIKLGDTDSKKTVWYVLKLAGSISFVGIGILGLTALTLATPYVFVSIELLTLGTIGTATSVVGQLWEGIFLK
jgi:hypothetical protein